MKKILCFTLALFICVVSSGYTAYAQRTAINISRTSAQDVFCENRYGIDLCKNDSAVPYGICADIVNNGSFNNNDNGWSFEGTNCVLAENDSVSKSNTKYDIVTVTGGCVIKNHGYGEKDAMGFTKGERYSFSCLIKNIDFEGEILIQLLSDKNKSNLVKLPADAISKKSWLPVNTEISALATQSGELAIIFNGNGSLQIDCISLVPESSYGYGKAEWKNVCLRNDIVNSFKMLNPSFIMFRADGSDWQNQIGESSQRADCGKMGCHEYLQLCRDLNTVAIPTFDADAINDTATTENYIQGIVDLIEYANADSLSSYFGALRAGNGSDEPFDLEYICVRGNGAVVQDIKNAVEKRFKGVTVLTDGLVESVCNITEYGAGLTKNNMGCAVSDAKQFISSNAGFVACSNAIGSANEPANKPCLITVDEYGLSLSPSYYVQMLLANNYGEQEISLSSIDEQITSKVTIDSARQILYICLVNEGSFSKTIDFMLDNFDAVDSASVMSVSSGYKSTANIMNKQRIAPECKEIEIEGNLLCAELDANSVSIIRVAYGGNTGQNIYQLPEELDCTEKLYLPPAVKVISVALCASIPVGSVIGFFLYKKHFSRKKGAHGNE